MEEELKPCPFCGALGTNPLLHSKKCYITIIHTALRNDTGRVVSPPDDVIIESWNSRFESEEVAELKRDNAELIGFVKKAPVAGFPKMVKWRRKILAVLSKKEEVKCLKK